MAMAKKTKKVANKKPRAAKRKATKRRATKKRVVKRKPAKKATKKGSKKPRAPKKATKKRRATKKRKATKTKKRARKSNKRVAPKKSKATKTKKPAKKKTAKKKPKKAAKKPARAAEEEVKAMKPMSPLKIARVQAEPAPVVHAEPDKAELASMDEAHAKEWSQSMEPETAVETEHVEHEAGESVVLQNDTAETMEEEAPTQEAGMESAVEAGVEEEPSQVEPTQEEPTQEEPTQEEPTQEEPTQEEPTQDVVEESSQMEGSASGFRVFAAQLEAPMQEVPVEQNLDGMHEEAFFSGVEEEVAMNEEAPAHVVEETPMTTAPEHAEFPVQEASIREEAPVATPAQAVEAPIQHEQAPMNDAPVETPIQHESQMREETPVEAVDRAQQHQEAPIEQEVEMHEAIATPVQAPIEQEVEMHEAIATPVEQPAPVFVQAEEAEEVEMEVSESPEPAQPETNYTTEGQVGASAFVPEVHDGPTFAPPPMQEVAAQQHEAMDADEEVMAAAPVPVVDPETQWKKAFVVVYRRMFPHGGGYPEREQQGWKYFLEQAGQLVQSPLTLAILETYPPTHYELEWLAQPSVAICCRFQACRSHACRSAEEHNVF